MSQENSNLDVKIRKLIPIPEFNKFHPDPSPRSIRWMILLPPPLERRYYYGNHDGYDYRQYTITESLQSSLAHVRSFHSQIW